LSNDIELEELHIHNLDFPIKQIYRNIKKIIFEKHEQRTENSIKSSILSPDTIVINKGVFTGFSS
jgi:hypothetical protein